MSCSTIYGDWLKRRAAAAQMAAQDGERSQGNRQDRAVHLLDYFISRYAEDPSVRQEARFPQPPEFFFNCIAAVVNHHLGIRRGNSGTKNAGEAAQRVSSILSRMAEAPDELLDDPFARNYDDIPAKLAKRIRRAWKQLSRVATLGLERQLSLSHAIKASAHGVFMATKGVNQTSKAVQVLTGTVNTMTVSYGLVAWRRLLASFGANWITDALEQQFFTRRHREKVLDSMRAALGDSSPAVRHRALQLMAKGLADAHDVGLLLDLYDLPAAEITAAEREQLLATIQALPQGIEAAQADENHSTSSSGGDV